jgi:hypothetical protein
MKSPWWSLQPPGWAEPPPVPEAPPRQSAEDLAAEVLERFLDAPLAVPLAEGATLEYLLGEFLVCSRIRDIHDQAMAVLLRAARGEAVQAPALSLIHTLCEEYAKEKQ